MTTEPSEQNTSTPAEGSGGSGGSPLFRAAFVTLFDARDVTKMSGTGYYISQSLLREGVHLDFIGPLSKQLNPINIGRHLFNRYILRNNDHPQRDTGFLKHYAKQVSQQLRELDVDIVFASGTLPVSYLDTDLPLVVWTDCTFANLLDYYPKYTNMSRRSIRDAHAAERAMYARADRMIFTSQWAADSAMSDYGLAPDRVEVISRAANIPEGKTEQDVLRMIEAKPKDRCILHFVGVDWERKGGDIAVEATRLLNERGIPAELRVVGAEPQIDGPMPEYVKPLGWISKSSPEGLKRFTELLSEAHFLIVPTRADAYGFAFLEASAFGVPSLAPRTGGVPMVMVDNVNGLLFDLEDSGAGYADAVERLYNNPNAYKELALSAFNDHLTRGNWRVVGKQLVRVLSEVLDSREAQDTRAKPDHPARSSEMDADPS